MNFKNIGGLPLQEEFGTKVENGLVLVFRQHPSVRWDRDNKHFRSSIWDIESGELVSPGFRAFTNYGEQPDFEPLNHRDRLEARIKKDGSSLIVSKHKGQPILRTRGTFSAYSMKNASDLPLLKDKYPKAFDNQWVDSEKYTMVFEWYSPSNVICLREASEPEIWLLAVIRHEDYRYLAQSETDAIAKEIGVMRPDVFPFNTFGEMVSAVEKFEDKEGVVIYSADGNTLKKVKGLRYLAIHKIKSQLNSEGALIDLYVECGQPSYNDFYTFIAEKFDYELAVQLMPEISKIVDWGKEVKRIIDGMNDFVNSIKGFATRKDQAQHILSSYGTTNRSGFVFSLLDGRPLAIDQIVKLYWQVSKK